MLAVHDAPSCSGEVRSEKFELPTPDSLLGDTCRKLQQTLGGFRGTSDKSHWCFERPPVLGVRDMPGGFRGIREPVTAFVLSTAPTWARIVTSKSTNVDVIREWRTCRCGADINRLH